MGQKIKVTGQGIDYIDVEIEKPDGSIRNIDLSVDEAHELMTDLESAMAGIKMDVAELYHKLKKLN